MGASGEDESAPATGCSHNGGEDVVELETAGVVVVECAGESRCIGSARVREERGVGAAGAATTSMIRLAF